MPINSAIAAAKQAEALRDRLTEFQAELDRVNTVRQELIAKIADLQSQYQAKRTELRQASADL